MDENQDTEVQIQPTSSTSQTWSDIVRDFTERTTFHGLRYITEDTRYTSRRLSWVLIVLTIIAVFSYAIISRILHFYERPVYIDLQVGYMEEVPFPAVTVCNQNPYRLSTLQKHGMYEVIREAYTTQKTSNGTSDSEACEEKYMLNPMTCTIPDNVIYTYQFVEVTLSTCKELCTTYAPDKCSGFLYELESRSCTLTSYTGEEKAWYTSEEVEEAKDACSDKMAYFYRKIRCAEFDVHCTFEDGDVSSETITTEKCRFEHDTSLGEVWTKRQGIDSTYGLENGHFLELLKSNSYTQTVARIQTDFMNTTSKCVMLGLKVDPSEELAVKVLKESLESVTVLSSKNWRTLDFFWNWLFVRLPSGFHRVIVEGSRAEIDNYQLMIDEVTILPCHELRKNCTRNPQGTFYLGDMYTEANGENCTEGGIFTYYLSDFTCDAYGYKSKDTPSCDCRETEFACNDGFCIPKSLTCDRTSDCLDGSDETPDLCGSKESFSCDFDDTYLCGYQNFGDLHSLWERRYCPSLDDRNGNGYLLQLNTDDSSILQGESALIKTPMESFPHNTLVQISIKSLLHPEDNGIAVYLYGSLGLSPNPVLVHGLSKVKRRAYNMQEVSLVQSVNDLGGRIKYGLCVPGGFGVRQSLVFQAVHTREDNYAIESVNITDKPCDLAENQEEAVFSQRSTLNCSFTRDTCDYSVLREHVQTSSMFIPMSRLQDIEQLGDWMNGNAGRFLSYKNTDYNKIFFESQGYIECGPGCINEWLIVGPDDSKIKVDVISIGPLSDDSKLCLKMSSPGEWLGSYLCESNTTYISDGNELEITVDDAKMIFQMKYEFISEDDQHIDSVLAFVYTGPFIQESYSFQLFSPALTITSTSCLTFAYLRRSPIRVTRTFLTSEWTLLFEDTKPPSSDGEEFVYMTITVRDYGNRPSFITFQSQKTQSGFPHYFLILKYTYFHSMSCYDYSLPHQKELQTQGKQINGTCDFEDEDQCGYMDMSWSHVKWTRDTILDGNDPDDEPDKYQHLMGSYLDQTHLLIFYKVPGQLRSVMRYGSLDKLMDEQSRLLLSPLLTVANDSCMHLTIAASEDAQYFFLRSSLRILINWISPWHINPYHQVYVSSKFEQHELDLPAGEYRLLFEPNIVQNGLNIYIDDIQILSPCPAPTTTDFQKTTSAFSLDRTQDLSTEDPAEDMFSTVSRTTVNVAFSEQTMFTSSKSLLETTKDYATTDMYYQGETSTEINTDGHTTPFAMQDSSPGRGRRAISDNEIASGNSTVTYIKDLYLSEEESKLYLLEKLDEMDFSQILSHRTDDFLISCTWNGQACNKSQISTTETDMGTCLSFNADMKDHLMVDKPGPLHGLQMILNIEKYEDVENTGTNSGIKIHFYPADDIPVMQSSGYFVSPGSHVLFNLQYTNNSFLEPEYGTCGKRDLASFPADEYSHARCLVQCSSDRLWEACQCYLPYMSTDVSRQCKISDYLNCVLPVKSSTANKCECPDACELVSYHTEFSTSTFSDEALATLLSNKEDAILQTYRKSLSIRERVRNGTFPRLFSQIHAMNMDNKALHALLKKDSIVGTVADALEHLKAGAGIDLNTIVTYYTEKLKQRNGENCSECRAQWVDVRDKLGSSAINSIRTSTKSLDDIQNWYELWFNREAANMVEMHQLANHFTSEQEPYSLYAVANIIAVLRGHLQQNVIQKMKTNIESSVINLIDFYSAIIDQMEKCHCMKEALPWDGYARSLSVLKQPKYDFQNKAQRSVSTEEDIIRILTEFSSIQFETDIKQYIEHIIREYSSDLIAQLDEYLTRYQTTESIFLASVGKVGTFMEDFKEGSTLDPDFIKDNIIQVEAYFGDLKYTQTAQKIEYGVGDFFSDLGGYLGLLLGASVVTVVEILDLIIYNMFNRHHPKEKTSRTSSRNSSTADTNSDTKTSLKTDECLVNMSRFMEQNEGNIASLNGRTKERDVTGDAADEDINAVEDSAPMKDKENDAGDDRKATTDDTGGHEIMENPSTFEIKVENKGDTIPLSDTTSMKGKENDIRDDIKVSGDKTDGNEDVDNMSMIEIEIENNVNN